jgi:amino acid transporter
VAAADPPSADPADGNGHLVAPSPDAKVAALSAEQLDALRQLGRCWEGAHGERQAWHDALPVDPELGRFPREVEPNRFGRFVSVASAATPAPDPDPVLGSTTPLSRIGLAGTAARRLIFGGPLRSTAIAGEKMRKLVALPVLSADALSSVAYGPEAMLAVLLLAGSSRLSLSLPLGAAIATLMLAVGVSYRQTIRAYPHGGGSYIVASENLGRISGLLAAGGLMTDYVLTVAVSVASGLAAVTSAIPSLRPEVVPIGAGVIVLLLAGNLRGVRQAGSLFAAPTYIFIVAIVALVGVGLVQAAGRGFHATAPPSSRPMEGFGVLLVLRAFASGSTAMTGIEAISNAVPAFEPTEWRNARTTLTWMVGLLMTLFVGTLIVIHFDGIAPRAGETVLSELAHRSFGSGPLYAVTQAATATVLLLAANTAFNDFPRVLFLLARDFQAPRLFLRMGDRLAFSNGIIALSVVAVAIFASFGGQTDALIPIYAVGVFLAFTLSQTGMVVHWRRHRERHWRRSAAFNAVGAVLSAVVFVIAGATKFTAGAWVAIVTILTIVVVAEGIRRHYERVSLATALHPLAGIQHSEPAGSQHSEQAGRDLPADPRGDPVLEQEDDEDPEAIRNMAIVPIESLDLVSLRALAYAASLGQPVLALHIATTDEDASRFRSYWTTWGDHLPLEVVISPYRAIVAPTVNYIESLHRQNPGLTLSVIIPELVVAHWWERILHDQIGARLRRALRPLPKIVITTVPFALSPRS